MSSVFVVHIVAIPSKYTTYIPYLNLVLIYNFFAFFATVVKNFFGKIFIT